MRDPFLTGLNKVKDEKDFEETLRFACRLWNQDEILFNLTVLLLGFSESHLQTCSAKSHLQTCVAYGGIKREVLPFTTMPRCSPAARGGFVWLSPSDLKLETL